MNRGACSIIIIFQLTMMEKKFSLLELDEKNVNRKLLVLNEENIKLKEETSKLITQVK